MVHDGLSSVWVFSIGDPDDGRHERYLERLFDNAAYTLASVH
jgi:hypothetical protein